MKHRQNEIPHVQGVSYRAVCATVLAMSLEQWHAHTCRTYITVTLPYLIICGYTCTSRCMVLECNHRQQITELDYTPTKRPCHGFIYMYMYINTRCGCIHIPK